MMLQIIRKGAEAAIRAEQAAKVTLTISEKNQATLVEINDQVSRLGKTSQDSWWQVINKFFNKIIIIIKDRLFRLIYITKHDYIDSL
jgi:hypothetical protein